MHPSWAEKAKAKSWLVILAVMANVEESRNDAELTEIPASEILDKIQKSEPVEYDHVWIIGDLDLRS